MLSGRKYLWIIYYAPSAVLVEKQRQSLGKVGRTGLISAKVLQQGSAVWTEATFTLYNETECLEEKEEAREEQTGTS